MKIYRIIVISLFLTASIVKPSIAAPIFKAKILQTRAHSSECYTQGLFFADGFLYESCGLYGQSTFKRWTFPPKKKSILAASKELPKKYFAEGAEAAQGEIYLLTWRENTGFVLDPESLLVKREFSYDGEGWGLAWDGEVLWRSDGSAKLYPHKLGDFSSAGASLKVKDEEKKLDITGLNELQWDKENDLILANIYGQDLVAAIDPKSGNVNFWLDCQELRSFAEMAGLSERSMDTVLNGLALAEDGLWLSGKKWPLMLKIAWPPEDFKTLPKP